MKKFTINQTAQTNESPFDRQERISWWSQEKIRDAKVMVVGAGAIGNETLKNLALLGFKNIFIVDFDTVSVSNLSRTILFRKEDVDLKKSEVAAKRTRELCLVDEPNINWFHGDVVWELGTGIFREMDIVLGCLDNAETRFAVNRQCWLAQTPWIDSGIYELSGAVSFYVPNQTPCYQCNASEEQISAVRKRYSCDDFKKLFISEGKAPTVQIASAIASAIQVQEAVKFICGQQAAAGKKIYFQGKINDFGVLNYSINPDCFAHTTYSDVTALPLSSEISLKDFLRFVSREAYSGDGAILDFRADRNFITTVTCRLCGKTIELFKPSFRIFDYETICSDCTAKGATKDDFVSTVETEKEMVSDFSLENSDERILEMSLRDLGVPYFHIVAVTDKAGNYKYYELSADKDKLLKTVYA
jgi:molybdopterin/thiamine biosynthesis adenylyltransferase